MSVGQKGVQTKVWWLGCGEQSLIPYQGSLDAEVKRQRCSHLSPALWEKGLGGRGRGDMVRADKGGAHGDRMGWGKEQRMEDEHGECEPAVTSVS